MRETTRFFGTSGEGFDGTLWRVKKKDGKHIPEPPITRLPEINLYGRTEVIDEDDRGDNGCWRGGGQEERRGG